MSTSIYLKKTLATNVPQVVTIKKRGGEYPEKDFNTKKETGRMTYLYIFEDPSGNEVKHYAKEQEQDTLKDFQPGEQLQVVLQEHVKNINGVDKRISYIVWTPKDGVEARSAATVQIHGNVAEKRMQDSQEDHAKQQRIKEVMISLAGLTQAYINAGVLDISEALEKASIARNLIIEKAISIVDHQ